MKTPRLLSAIATLSLAVTTVLAAAPTATLFISTADQPWTSSVLTPAPADATPPLVRVVPDRTYQTIDGFGGCFNELGWIALARATPADRARVLSALFADTGLGFNLARIPVGASDFATDAYSLDDTPDDLALAHFSIDRDRRDLLPFIKAAMAVRPSLRCWASPWSPPAWMKTNGNYSRGSIRWEPAILRAYADYLGRWVAAYRAEGVNLFALAPQNESNILSPYPSCLWTGAQLRDFIADYLGPVLRRRQPAVQLWLGTLNGDRSNDGNNINYRFATVLDDPRARAYVSAATFQYDGADLIGEAHALYPDLKLVQSETECESGKNSWADALKLYALMRHYLDGGASSYFAWNMVLDDTGLSTWKWRQNALVTIDRATGAVTFNGEYYVMRHFSACVTPGARRVLATGPWGDKIAFVNPDGSTVVVLANTAAKPLPVTLAVAGRADAGFRATLPARSVATLVIPPAQ